MHGSETDLLKSIVQAANGWRATATAASVSLTQLNVVLPDGIPLSLFWEESVSDWRITTS